MTLSRRSTDAPSAVLLRRATLQNGDEVDVRVTGARIDEVGQAGSLVARAREDDVDLDGYVLLPAPAEPHAHLDKALTADRFSVPAGSLGEAIHTWRAYRRHLEAADIAARARAGALLGLSHGVTAVRTHVDVGEGIGLCAAEALIGLREELRGLIDIQVTALVSPLVDEEWMDSVGMLRSAAALGVDLVGGAPHVTPDPRRYLEDCLAVAAEFDKPVDFHMDEHLRDSVDLIDLIRLVSAGFPNPVTASHCVSLGSRPAEVQAEVAVGMARAGISVVTCPLTNLLLQGRDMPTATPRGLTALRALLDAGVSVAGGGDNVQDLFNPLGSCDPLQTAQLLVAAGQLDVSESYRLVSDGARAVMGLPPVRVEPGFPAQLLAVAGDSLRAVIATATEDRIVIRDGRVVSRTRLVREDYGSSRPRPEYSRVPVGDY